MNHESIKSQIKALRARLNDPKLKVGSRYAVVNKIKSLEAQLSQSNWNKFLAQ